MTYLFDPSLLEKLIIGPVLKGKDVTINANSKDHRYLLRPLKSTDLDYLRLLKQLTTVGEVTESDFESKYLFCLNLQERFEEFTARPKTYFIIVLEDLTQKKLVGSATLLVELKIIHNCSKRGHIEDVVVDEAYRNQGFGKILVAILVKVGEAQGCYKISLDCAKDKVQFYELNGFKQETISMCVRLSN